MDTYSHIISGMPEYMMALLDEVPPSGVISGGLYGGACLIERGCVDEILGRGNL